MKTTVTITNLGPDARLVGLVTTEPAAAGRQHLTATSVLAARQGDVWNIYDADPQVAPTDGGFDGRRLIGVAKSESEIQVAAMVAADRVLPHTRVTF